MTIKLRHEPVNKFLKCPKCGATDIKYMYWQVNVVQTTPLVAYSRHGNLVWDSNKSNFSDGADGKIKCSLCDSEVPNTGGNWSFAEYESYQGCEVIDGVVTRCAEWEHKWED